MTIRIISLCKACLVLLLVASCDKKRKEPQPTIGTLSGTISIVGDTTKLHSVNVSVKEGLSDITDENGHFSIENITIGTYQVVFSHIDYVEDTVQLSIVAGENEITQALRPIESLLAIHSEQLAEGSKKFDFGKNTNVFEFEISNHGDKALHWVITEDKKWLTSNISNGINDAVVQLSVNRDSLFKESETASLVIKDQNSEQQQQLLLTLEKDIPVMTLSSNDFVLEDVLDFGTAKDELSLHISNSGEGKLFWEVTAKPDFVTLNQTEGMGESDLVLHLDTSKINHEWRMHQGILKLQNKANLHTVFLEIRVDNTVSLVLSPHDGSFDFGPLMRGKVTDLIINNRFPIDWEFEEAEIRHSILSEWFTVPKNKGEGSELIDLLVDRYNTLGTGFPDYHAFDYDTADVSINYLNGTQQMSFQVTAEKKLKRFSDNIIFYNNIKQAAFGMAEVGVSGGYQVSIFLHNYIEGILRLDFNTTTGVLLEGEYPFSSYGEAGTTHYDSFWSYRDHLLNKVKFKAGGAHVQRLAEDHWFYIEFQFTLENDETIEGSFTAYFPELE